MNLNYIYGVSVTLFNFIPNLNFTTCNYVIELRDTYANIKIIKNAKLIDFTALTWRQ